jgi:hypothetical protein
MSHHLVVVLRTTPILGGFVLLLALTLIRVNLQPATAQSDLILITRVDAGSGSVSPNCPAPTGCDESANFGNTVTITATPSSGFQFSSWSPQTEASCIGGPTVNPCQVQMPLGDIITHTITIGATFVQVVFPAVHPTPVGGAMLPTVGFTVLLPWAVLLSLLGVLSVEAFRVRGRAKRR